MRQAHTVAQVREAERRLLAELPEGALMATAAAGLASAVSDLLGRTYGARVLLLVGSGDNGGDVLFAGARLAARGAKVEAVLLSASVHPGGLTALTRAGGWVVDDPAEPDVIIDGIVGIGGRPGLRPDAVAALALFPDVPIVAADVPSGVSVDDGVVDGPHVTATMTVAFGTLKICHLVDPAAAAAGVVHLVDLGLDLPAAPVEALQEADVAALLPEPVPFDHKYTRGVVGVMAGSALYPGAAVLATAGAGCGLAGMVRYVGAAADQVRAAHPEIVVGEGRVQAWVVGSGGAEDAEEALRTAVADGVPVLADADALRHVTTLPGGVLTPHAGELAAMLGVDREVVEAAQLEHVRLAAERFEAVVVLKGRHALIAEPGGRVRVNTSGTPWLATAGAGDVLAGLIGALLAAGLDPFDAASVGCYLHGAAAAYAGASLRARDVADALPDVVRTLHAGTDAGLGE